MEIRAGQDDIREAIFGPLGSRTYRARISVARSGVLAGMRRLENSLADSLVRVSLQAQDGEAVEAGARVASLEGTAPKIAAAEENAVGLLAKSSGIATVARRAVNLAGSDLKVVAGAWKKMPPQIKELVREAVVCGGASFRITDQPFLYLDKNYVRMLGGIDSTLAAVKNIAGKLKIIQLRGEYGGIAKESVLAARRGADIIMIDTGRLEDVAAAQDALATAGLRQKIKLAFAGGILVEAIPALKDRGIDIVDIGVDIVDAPLLDMRLDVVS